MLGVTRIINCVLLLVGVSCTTETMALECPYSDPTCWCSGQDASCDALEMLSPVRSGNGVYNVTNLILRGYGVNSLSKENLPAGLQYLYLSLCPLTNISDDAFDHSAITLGSLEIFNATFKQLPQALLKLTNLTDLRLIDIPIDQWQDSILRHIAPRVTVLYLTNVNLHGWPSWLSYFHSLTFLDLSRNLLSNIPDNAFQELANKLQSLRLTNTGLTKISQSLSSLTSLLSLDLSYNRLSEAEVERLNSFPLADTLSGLSVDSVGLSTFPNLSHLTHLGLLNLDNNNVSHPKTGSFPQSIVALYISGNSLSSVPAAVANLSNLSFLYVENNAITEIQPHSLPLGLFTLLLSKNKLTTITNTTFTNLNHLDSLSLEDNPISVIETGAFSDLLSLHTLSITFTDLTKVPLAFISLPSDILIDIYSHNRISCPCPAAPELITWYRSLAVITFTTQECSNGQSISSYLGGQCHP